ncbi:MAG: ABC transporter substrate-binding protein [Candidatus Tectomicrobia bacterium]|nr:ABC transporter substrate-binding protein [Candidatus Tectomicrobia bacterium]
MKRNGSLVCLIALIWMLVLGVARGAEKTQIRFAENWVMSGEHIGEFVALEKGWYTAEGVDIEIRRGHGAVDTYKRVTAGDLDVGRSVMVSVALGRAQGAKAKIVQVTMHTSPYGLAFLKGVGIEKPKDLEGRKVAIPSGSSVLQFWPAFAKVNRIDLQRTPIIHMGPAALVPSLAAGKVEATDAWLNSLLAFEEAAVQQGRQIGHFLWSDYGLSDMYGSAFVASDDTVAKRPQLIQKFIRATVRGTSWAFENPKEGVDIFMKHNTTSKRSIIEAQWKYMKRLSFDGHTQQEGLGHVNAGKIARALKLVDQYVGLKTPVKAEDLYTNEFISNVPREWRFPKVQ